MITLSLDTQLPPLHLGKKQCLFTLEGRFDYLGTFFRWIPVNSIYLSRALKLIIQNFTHAIKVHNVTT